MAEIPAPCPPWTSLGRQIEKKIRKALYQFEMFPEGTENVAIALSGGKDSLTLLYMLHAINGRGFPKFNLHAIHVSGEFSCGAGVNTSFLRSICDRLEVSFIVRESHQKLETLECYSCSRERRKLLFDAAKEVDAQLIAFGHHSDDSAQTLLMNLLQKGEFAGNLPKVHMQKYGVTILRPLILVREQEIRSFAQQSGFARISCRCPVGQNSMRKKVDQLLDEMTIHYPHARENIARAIMLYGSDKANRL